MLFNSIDFIIFFPIVVICYFVIPQKFRNIWLLLASYYFYMSWSAKYAILILFSTVITYLCGLFIEKIRQNNYDNNQENRLKNMIVAISMIINLGILCWFKYTNFFLGIVMQIFAKINIQLSVPVFDIMLPVGISFYTFQAIGYTIDVYRGDIKAEKNFLKYALFVSFFPQLVAGPIERSKNLLEQLSAKSKISYENIKDGFYVMLWGYFVKIVIADRAALFVDTIYANPDNHRGFFIFVAALLFAVQIYCDFYGYSLIAKGAAKFLGINLMENFNYPYLRENIAEFWRGWHISLSTWFRDYLYIPLGGNRRGKLRKYINLMIVFLVSGLWHGASISFVIWGGLHGLYQIIGDICKPVRIKICQKLGIDRTAIGYRVLCIVVTFLLATFAFIFFRADSAMVAVNVIKNMFTNMNPWILFDGSLFECGLNAKNFRLLMLCIFILLIADIAKKNNIVIREVILKQHVFYRTIFVVLALVIILTFGIWGPAYDAAGFIYFQF